MSVGFKASTFSEWRYFWVGGTKELSSCNKLWYFNPYSFATRCHRPLIFYTINSVIVNSLSLKYQRFIPSRFKEKGIRKLEFVVRISFFKHIFNIFSCKEGGWGGVLPLAKLPLWMMLWSRFYRSDLFFLSLYQFKCSHPIHQSSCKHQILYSKGNPTGWFRKKTQKMIFLRFRIYYLFVFTEH